MGPLGNSLVLEPGGEVARATRAGAAPGFGAPGLPWAGVMLEYYGVQAAWAAGPVLRVACARCMGRRARRWRLGHGRAG